MFPSAACRDRPSAARRVYEARQPQTAGCRVPSHACSGQAGCWWCSTKVDEACRAQVSWKLDDSPPGHSWTPTGLLAQKAPRGWHDEDRGRPFGPARPSDASAGAYRPPIRMLVASWRSDLEPQLATSSSPSVGRKWPEAPGIHRA